MDLPVAELFKSLPKDDNELQGNDERAFKLKDIRFPCPESEWTGEDKDWCNATDVGKAIEFLDGTIWDPMNSNEIIKHACSHTPNTDIAQNLMRFNFDNAVLRGTLEYAEKGFLGHIKPPNKNM